ncbi:MBL fold metallo-hydrolase [Lentisphaera profundi]|uniref:MBL fold metallo-hydrolase n=1 Tax=Lentisphaera profundi TaxID=1658616 RepID=A0ABY7VPI2_9BACT|nr:MBL fold metallo-hydrolase [Lentisphaera profundi]WDE95629.1 MBL fold metallo-hydrolase [Lentisphaera profundi]
MKNALITFWGCRGSIATPGRSTERYGGNTSCTCLKHGQEYFIFDAGTGIRGLGLELMELVEQHFDGHTIELNIFLSHTHWDHIQGLPFFQPAYDSRFKLNIYGSENKDDMLEKTLSGQMNSAYFPVPMSQLNSELNVHADLQALNINGVKVCSAAQNHPGGSTAFKVTLDDGRTLVYATDNELDLQFHSDGTPKDDMGQRYFELISKVDYLIADGQYTDEEYPTKIGWGHTSLSLIHKIAYLAEVKNLVIYHHDPMHTDSVLEDLSHKYTHEYESLTPPMQVIWAREGLTLQLRS